MDIGARLKATRELRGLTLKEVGQAIGVSDATVQRYESGEIDIKRTIAIKLGECLSVSPSFIMGWSDSPLPESINDDSCPNGKVSESPSPQGANEVQLLNYYRSMDPDGKSRLMEIAELLSEKYRKDGKSDSIAG